MDLADTYISFVRQNQDILREKVNEEIYIEKLFDVSNSCLYYVMQCFVNSYYLEFYFTSGAAPKFSKFLRKF